MDTSTIIMGIILFALATMIVYAWGMVRQNRQTSDLMNMLFSKGMSRVKKYMKKNEYITIADVEKLCENLSVKQPFSQNRAVVKNKRDFAGKLVEYMVKTNQLEIEGNRYKRVKK